MNDATYGCPDSDSLEGPVHRIQKWQLEYYGLPKLTYGVLQCLVVGHKDCEESARTVTMATSDHGASVLLALACGDALGEPVEGWSADRIAAEHGTLTEFVDGRVPPGGLTDDTAQALRLARSLVDCEGFDPDDSTRRFVEWFEGGAVGIGGLTRSVLGRIAEGEHWEQASRAVWEAHPEGHNAGNVSDQYVPMQGRNQTRYQIPSIERHANQTFRLR